MVGRVLAALEQVPGEPSDLTALLREPEERLALIGPEDNYGEEKTAGWDAGLTTPKSDLGRFLAENIDHGRVEAWSKVVERGISEGRFEPMLFGWSDYPRRLEVVCDAPPVLFRRIDGRVPGSTDIPTDDPTKLAVAIVGSRDTSREVISAARNMASALGEHGLRIVSGLAAGVDTAAHQGALDVAAVTTAVMGTGTDHVFPVGNTVLAGEIAKSGVVLSQFAPSAPRTGTTFLRRNCIIAAMSEASIVMDAEAKSGSTHELEQALRYGKRVLLWRPALGRKPWAQGLEEAGLAAFVDSPEEILAILR